MGRTVMIMDIKKLNIFASVVKALQYNDKNGSYDEILQYYDYNFTEALRCLTECLKRIIEDEGMEGDELDFYVSQFSRVQAIC